MDVKRKWMERNMEGNERKILEMNGNERKIDRNQRKMKRNEKKNEWK